MKTSKIYFTFFIIVYILSAAILSAQDIFAYKMIGKPRTEVVQKYGKPVHIDKTDPSMVCMFYQRNNDRMVFVSDQNSVFQVEVSKAYASESGAMNELHKLLAEAAGENFTTDTLSVSEYKLHKTNVDFSVVLMHNANLSKHEVRVKANRK